MKKALLVTLIGAAIVSNSAIADKTSMSSYKAIPANLAQHLKERDGCGAGDWRDTGVSGPLGWTWHWDADRTTGPDANFICANFYSAINNCNDALPKTVPHQGGVDYYTYNACSYNTGLYTIDGLSEGGANTHTVCAVC